MGSRKHKIPKNKNTTKRFRRTRSKKQRGSGAQCSRPGYVEEEDPNTIDEYLALAIEEETPRCVKKYLDKGANPNILILDNLELRPPGQASRQVPAIIYAARHIQPSTILKYLVAKGAFLEPDLGTTLLIEAAEYGNLSAASYLLSIGADINATTGSGVTAIGYAVFSEDIPMIELMLKERKGKIDLHYTEFGRNARHVIDDAEQNTQTANPEIAKILKKYVIEQNIIPKQVRQQDRLNLGRVVQGVRGTSNRGPGGKLPLDITRMMEGDTSHINQWSTTNSYLGGKRKNKTRKRRTKRTTRRGVQKGRDEVIS